MQDDPPKYLHYGDSAALSFPDLKIPGLPCLLFHERLWIDVMDDEVNR